jgi:hypothetical protein
MQIKIDVMIGGKISPLYFEMQMEIGVMIREKNFSPPF